MKNKNRTLTLSLAFTTIFAIALVILTLGAPWIVEFLCEFFHRDYLAKFLTVVTYLAVPAGWGAIILLYRILLNVDKGNVFEEENVKYLSILSWHLCWRFKWICFTKIYNVYHYFNFSIFYRSYCSCCTQYNQ